MFITKKLKPKHKEVQELLFNNDESFEEVNESTSFFVKEILLLNKSGLPILSRVYKHTAFTSPVSEEESGDSEEQDPLLIPAGSPFNLYFLDNIIR